MPLSKSTARRTWVVHGSDGTDELTTTGYSYVAALDSGEVTTFEISPSDAGLSEVKPEDLKGRAQAVEPETKGPAGTTAVRLGAKRRPQPNAWFPVTNQDLGTYFNNEEAKGIFKFKNNPVSFKRINFSKTTYPPISNSDCRLTFSNYRKNIILN